MAPSGELESVNRPIIEYFGRSVEELKTGGQAMQYILKTSRVSKNL
jgi:hypothetical protein